MDDLKIKKDGKIIFDSHGTTLNHLDSLEIARNVMESVTSTKITNEITITIKSTAPSSHSLVENELNHNVAKL
jgi:hypothetical protein